MKGILPDPSKNALQRLAMHALSPTLHCGKGAPKNVIKKVTNQETGCLRI